MEVVHKVELVADFVSIQDSTRNWSCSKHSYRAGDYLDNYTFWSVVRSCRFRLQDIPRSLDEVFHSGKSISVKRVRVVEI